MDLRDFFYEATYNTATHGRLFFPPKILWGPGVLEDIYGLLRSKTEVFVDASVVSNSIISEHVNKLRERLNTSVVVVNKPSYERILEYCEEAPRAPDCVVAIGGGSTFDFCKATIALRCLGSVSGLGIGSSSGKQTVVHDLPRFLAVPTTCGSGAEASRYVVTYSDESNAKVHGKSWGLVADWIFVEPHLLSSAPIDTVIASAFDAFVHFFETLAMKHETSLFSEMLSVFGMSGVITNLSKFLRSNGADLESAQNLMLLGTLGGVAISNTRTGHIHEAAGALIEHIPMSHGFSLYVFFQDLARDMFTALPDRFVRFWPTLDERETGMLIRNEDQLFKWWDLMFSNTNFGSQCQSFHSEFSGHEMELHSDIVSRINSDSVWITKESPFRVEIQTISQQIRQATHRAFAGGG